MLSGLFSSPLKPGVEAPDFELPDQDGKAVRLGDFSGRNLMLVFYPGDNTPVCTKQLCAVRDAENVLAGHQVEVLGINPFGAGSHRAFRQKNRFQFPLLVDSGGHVADAYHARILGFTRRTVYLIDGSGIIRFSERGKPDPVHVVRSLQARKGSKA